MELTFAPLEGITTWVFRALHHEMFPGAAAYYAPFFAPTMDSPLTGRGLDDLLPAHNEGVPLVPQLLTNRADAFLAASAELEALGYEEVNLNLGCPSGTVVAKRKGSGFLGLPAELDAFLDEVFSRTRLRVSVKTRVGLEDPAEWPALLDVFNKYPIAELTVHPRVRKDFYREPVRLEAFRYAVDHTALPLCYNGDLNSAGDCSAFAAAFPTVRRAMVGRGMVANPALAREYQAGAPLNKGELQDFHHRLTEAYRALYSGDRPVLGKMKELWFYMGALFDGPDKPLKAIRKARTLDAYLDAANALFRDCDLIPGGKFVFRP